MATPEKRASPEINAEDAPAAKRANPEETAAAPAAPAAPAPVPISEERTYTEAPTMARDSRTSTVRKSRLPPAAWAWGGNICCELGHGDTVYRSTPAEITALRGRHARTAACTTYRTFIVVDGGELWTVGENFFGQLGIDDAQDDGTLARVPGLRGRKVVAVACGVHHTLALCKSGEFYAWGLNTEGQLGIGNTGSRRAPELLETLSDIRITAIACGGKHSVAMSALGKLFVWGDNHAGQLGLGDTEERNVPTQVSALARKRAVAVSCGGAYTVAVLESGELFSWGLNGDGQLGHGDLSDKNTPQLVKALRDRPVSAIACGWSHALALLRTGEIFAWGDNIVGALGLGETSRAPISTPQQVHFFDDKHVVLIHCSDCSSGAVLKSGELFLWGDNDEGQLGTGDKMKRITPTPVVGLAGKRVISFALASSHTIALVQ